MKHANFPREGGRAHFDYKMDHANVTLVELSNARHVNNLSFKAAGCWLRAVICGNRPQESMKWKIDFSVYRVKFSFDRMKKGFTVFRR